MVVVVAVVVVVVVAVVVVVVVIQSKEHTELYLQASFYWCLITKSTTNMYSSTH